MNITCTGRKVVIKDNFAERVDKRLAKLDKFFAEEAEAQVTVVVEKSYQTVEITIRDGSFVVRAERSAEQMEEAFDEAADVITKNLVKNRKRLIEKMQRPPEHFEEYLSEPEEADAFEMVKEKHFVVKPASVEEAILQMKLLGHSFYLFRDEFSDEINLVYSRKDGSYGLLIPEK